MPQSMPPVQPMIYQTVKVIPSVPVRTNTVPRQRPITINDQISVYCPVCRRDFYNSQV